jgi:hypothetical protein
MTSAVRRIPFGEVDARSQQVFVRAADGVRLATDVYLPTAVRRAPTVLVRLPYDKSGAFSFMSPVAERLTALGYAVVVQDVRGKVRSEGRTLAFVHEVRDGWDTLEWVAAQPWSDGAVGMFGDSYYGFTQWAASASGHPALRAMVPRMTTTEVGTDWMHAQGVFNLGTMGEWAAHAWVENALVEAGLDWSVRPLADVVRASLDGAGSASFDTWRRRGPNDSYWRDDVFAGCSPRHGALPTLHTGGWYDVFARGQLRDHARALRGPRPADQHLVMGATDHFDDELTPSGRTQDYLADRTLLEGFLDGYLGPATKFFDRHLRGGDVVVPRVRWQLGTAGWQESPTWPPPQAQPLVLHLADARAAGDGPQGGVLAERPDSHAATASWTHDPQAPVPSLVDDPWRPLLRLPDEREVQVRDDVLTFSTGELRAPLDLAGPVRAELTVVAAAPSTHVVAKLLDVAPSGEARLVLEGAALVREPWEGARVVVDLGDTGHRLEVGHVLRLSVAASSFPRWVVHPGTSEDPFTATRTRRVEHRLRAGGADPSRVVLTVLPAPPGAPPHPFA